MPTDPASRKPSEYAQKDEQAKQQAAEGRERKKYTPPKKTGLLFKLIGLVLVAFAGWLGYRWITTGKAPDLSDQGLGEVTKDLTGDVNKAADAAKPLAEKSLAAINGLLADLKEKIKGKPPETKEEIAALVKEDQEALTQEDVARPWKPSGKAPPKAAGESASASKSAPKASGALAEAQAAYAAGAKLYVKTNPMSASQSEVQKYIREAAPHFQKCMDLCEKARGEGQRGETVDALEQMAAKRLYDCNKRMELH